MIRTISPPVWSAGSSFGEMWARSMSVTSGERLRPMCSNMRRRKNHDRENCQDGGNVMSTLQKAMVLLDIARDHYRMPVMDEMTYRMQSTISARFSVILEGYSKWPNWEATTARDA